MNNTKFRLGAIMMIALVSTIIGIGVTPILLQHQSAYSVGGGVDDKRRTSVFGIGGGVDDRKAPPAITGDNVYVAWWDNKTGNNEVFFRASNDKGQTFGDKINLSNTPNAESTRVEIDSDANSVVVTWWETNHTASTPVMKISTDNGKMFGPIIKLSTNGTIGSTGGGG
jgi:hypothetical protein